MISWPLVIERARCPQACLEYICIALFWHTAGNYQQPPASLAFTPLVFLIFPFSHFILCVFSLSGLPEIPMLTANHLFRLIRICADQYLIACSLMHRKTNNFVPEFRLLYLPASVSPDWDSNSSPVSHMPPP